MFRKKWPEHVTYPMLKPKRKDFIHPQMPFSLKRLHQKRRYRNITGIPKAHPRSVRMKLNLIKLQWRNRFFPGHRNRPNNRRRWDRTRRNLQYRIEQATKYRTAVKRFTDNIRVAIPEYDTDGLYQMTLFYGDPDSPELYQWADVIRKRTEKLIPRELMEGVVDLRYGPEVQIRFNPLRFVFDSERAAMAFLLRWS